jgi:hypothetical protein
MSKHKCIWVVWWIGAILIVLSWVNVVPVEIGWTGFGIAVVSIIASMIQQKCCSSPGAASCQRPSQEAVEGDELGGPPD